MVRQAVPPPAVELLYQCLLTGVAVSLDPPVPQQRDQGPQALVDEGVVGDGQVVDQAKESHQHAAKHVAAKEHT